MRIDAVQTIKQQLNMVDVLSKYGYKPNRAGFICCMFHNEKTPSMKIFEKVYHCFGCGEHGDTISFVQKLFNISFPETLKKIDIDFGLNLYGDKTFEELRKSHYQTKQLQAERKRKEIEKQHAEEKYLDMLSEWVRLEKNKREYAPKTLDEEWNPLFVEALQKLAYQEYLLDMM